MSKKKTKELLEKAVDLLEEHPESQETPAESNDNPTKKARPPLTEARKRALISYMAILFAVAFLLVALSLAIQYRNSQNTISQLGQSADSALAKADALQEENRLLQQELKDTQDTLSQLQDKLEGKVDTIAELKAALELQQGSITELLQEKLDTENKLVAYQLLSRAQQALREEDYKALHTILHELVDNTQYLEEQDLMIYQELTLALAENRP